MNSDANAVASDDEGLSRRPRAQNIDVAQAKAAKAAIRDINVRMTRWHSEIARLRGLVEYGAARGTRPSIDPRLEALAADIAEQHVAFKATIAKLPAAIAANGWISDKERVLCRATETVRSLQALQLGR